MAILFFTFATILAIISLSLVAYGFRLRSNSGHVPHERERAGYIMFTGGFVFAFTLAFTSLFVVFAILP